MGISIDVWRARIGSFSGHQLKSDSSFSEGCCDQNWNSSYCLHSTCFNLMGVVAFHFIVLFMCLIIGNVEMNPGPAFTCPSCNFKSSSLLNCAFHQQVHRHEKNFAFRCPGILCKSKLFISYPGLLNHIKEFHPNKEGGSSGVSSRPIPGLMCTA